MALIYFAVTLFVSAFLLFLVQPMIGKMILPRLGGTPQVWNTCMMFFQMTLLAGYAYTHNVTSRLPVKKQLLVHGLMLLVPIVVLLLPVLLVADGGRPFYVAGFGAEGGSSPIWPTLALLVMIVGLPFLVVSTTAPLLQRWFHNTGHPAAADPYFLYGASNLGSILGLILYPVTVEYFLGLDAQAWFWFYGYLVLAILVTGCALLVLKAPPTVQLPGAADDAAALEPPPAEIPAAAAPSPEPATTAVTATPPTPAARATGIRRGGKQRGRGGRGPALPATPKSEPINIKKSKEPEPVEEEKPYEITFMRRLRWVGLAAVPTSLMLGTTTYISTDISPIPLLWIIPLTLYLLSFVLVFSRWPVPWVGVGRNPRNWTPHKVMIAIQMFLIPVLVIALMNNFYIPDIEITALRWGVFCLVYYGPFFITALVCHGELARDRPPAKQLTEFYLWMSVGGMIGGTFNALFAPAVWPLTMCGLYEFPLALVLALWVRPQGPGSSWTDKLIEGLPKEQRDGLRYLMDFSLALLLLGFTWFLIYNMSNAESGWFRWRVTGYRTVDSLDKFNSLFRILHKGFGMEPDRALGMTSWLSMLITFGLPVGLAVLTWKRPMRLALCFGAVLLGNAFYQVGADERTLERDRSYFGILRVVEDKDWFDAERKRIAYTASTLMHGSTHHGLNYSYPDGTKPAWSSTASPDMRRLATTYYHRDCPVGIVMEKLNWFPGYKAAGADGKDVEKRMTYWADSRLPASLIGNGAAGLGMVLPLPQLGSAWSEPAYATIGLGTGTMSSYSRPFQHMTFYEIDEHIRNFSLPPSGRPTYFTYVQGALRRGTRLEIIMGDARLTMTKELVNDGGTYYVPNFKGANTSATPVGSEWAGSTSYPKRESYYRAIEVDAFSSDAIPVHLITKEAIELYMDKLMPNGVLCVHTSNRHVNLVQPVMNICSVAEWKDWTDLDENGKPRIKKGGLAWVVAKDEGGQERGRSIDWNAPSENGHFSSEYILVARKQEYLPPYTLTKEEIANYKALGAYATTFTYQQQEDYAKEGLKLMPLTRLRTGSQSEKVLYSSTVDFYLPDSYTDPKVNYTFTLRNGRTTTIMDYHGYFVPPGARVWTDDYSNVLSVFRWSR